MGLLFKPNEGLYDFHSQRFDDVFYFHLYFFRQIEEAEEIAALNLAKFRKAQVDMQESLERADISEQALAKSRVRGRSMSLARDL
jgi:hypothetical protein